MIPTRLYNHYSITANNSNVGSGTPPTAFPVDDIHQILSTIPTMGRGLTVGQYATTTRTYTSEEVDGFGNLIRDFNPLHSSPCIDSWEEEADKELFELQRSALEASGLIRGKALVHGMFVSSIFSSIFASIAPGCVYVNQDLDFKAPVFAEDTVVGSIKIAKIRDWTRRKGGVVAECQTRIYKLIPSEETNISGPSQAELVIKGTANVWLPIGHM